MILNLSTNNAFFVVGQRWFGLVLSESYLFVTSWPFLQPRVKITPLLSFQSRFLNWHKKWSLSMTQLTSKKLWYYQGSSQYYYWNFFGGFNDFSALFMILREGSLCGKGSSSRSATALSHYAKIKSKPPWVSKANCWKLSSVIIVNNFECLTLSCWIKFYHDDLPDENEHTALLQIGNVLIRSQVVFYANQES